MFGDEELINIEEQATELLDWYELEELLEIAGIAQLDLVKYLILEGIIKYDEIDQAN